ncbi:MAG: DUF1559 family PulG-like putative transporter [Planctomycetota bacterium]|jgi:hypothetical protein
MQLSKEILGSAILICLLTEVCRTADRIPDELETQSRWNLKQIGLAFHNYHERHGHLPEAASRDRDGNPLLSWRVQLLPYLGDEAERLHGEFNLDEPWDSPHNRQLVGRMPDVYSSPMKAPLPHGQTCYMVVRGDNTLFPFYVKDRNDFRTRSFADIYQGLPNIILAVEVDHDVAVPWSKPIDLPPQPQGSIQGPGTPLRRWISLLLGIRSDLACPEFTTTRPQRS